jgi:hypothetical protein
MPCLCGCDKGARFSQKELEEIKQGGPKQMPPEGRKLMEDIAAGRVKRPVPPRPVGQPGPSMPVVPGGGDPSAAQPGVR